MRFTPVLTALVVLVLGAAAPSIAADGAPLLRVPKYEVDLGTQKSGPLLWFPFKLRNEGAAPLEIKDVQVSCGCMAVQTQKTIAPAKEITLWVRMTTAG